MNLRPGVDTHPPDFYVIVKLDLPFEERDRAIDFLKAVEAVTREKLDPGRVHGTVRGPDGARHPRLAVRDCRLNLLVGFGLRFFLGPLDARPPEEIIPNFPPGGAFKPRTPTRFGMTDRRVPLYLRTMNAAGDDAWIKKQLTARSGGVAPSDAEVAAAYRSWLGRSESDLILIFESDNLFLVVDFWDAVRRRAVVPSGVRVVALHEAYNRDDGRDHIGFHDGVSNLVDKMESDPAGYRSKIYLPHPAPAYPGEPAWARDDPRYDGGTYLVHRKYVEDLEKWRSEVFTVTDHDARAFHGAEARAHAVGRDEASGRVLSRFHGRPLDREPDGAEVNLGYHESHVLKARGGTTAPFSGDFPPVKLGETNVFNPQDIRIRRRGVSFAEIDPETGAVTYGLHFICFQNNIQQTGFEFINNIWLFNPHFHRSVDTMFDPDRGIIAPLEGCYYFVPAEHQGYPGDVFFEPARGA